jgi:hypothetical protein
MISCGIITLDLYGSIIVISLLLTLSRAISSDFPSGFVYAIFLSIVSLVSSTVSNDPERVNIVGSVSPSGYMNGASVFWGSKSDSSVSDVLILNRLVLCGVLHGKSCGLDEPVLNGALVGVLNGALVGVLNGALDGLLHGKTCVLDDLVSDEVVLDGLLHGKTCVLDDLVSDEVVLDGLLHGKTCVLDDLVSDEVVLDGLLHGKTCVLDDLVSDEVVLDGLLHGKTCVLDDLVSDEVVLDGLLHGKTCVLDDLVSDELVLGGTMRNGLVSLIIYDPL